MGIPDIYLSIREIIDDCREHAKDMAEFRKYDSRFDEIPDDVITSLYHEFSEYNYAAGWHSLCDEILNDFCEWVFSSPVDLAMRKVA